MMTREQMIKQFIGDIKTIKILEGTTTDKVELINNQYILKNIKDSAVECANWYRDNPSFGPELVSSSNDLVLYKYIVGNEERISKRLIIDFVSAYKPSVSDMISSVYQSNLEIMYEHDCELVSLEQYQLSEFPEMELYHLHGDMGLHNLIISESIKQIDPEPISGFREHDILQFYLSSPIIINLLTIEELTKYCNQDSIKYLLPILVANRIVRSKYHHPQDLEFYINYYKDLA